VTDRFAGKTAIVTGASRGIGLAIAQRLVRDGARVVITARQPEALDQAVSALGGPDHAFAVAGSAEDPDHQAETVGRALEMFGSVDLLVNNAGISPAIRPLADIDSDIVSLTVQVNALAPLAWIICAHRAWMAEHGGAVVNVTSMAGVVPSPGIGMYGGSKALLAYLTRQLAVELSPGVRVNAVAPAIVKSQMSSGIYEGREDFVASMYPLKRLGVPEDVTGAVSFLLSDEASWITGQEFVIDGGVTSTGHGAPARESS
jgi:NAD(P)-dependent dehydrogenase (short-subunit alcohol dehydrogenase family)